MNKTVLITGIGGNVGQGILRNIIRCRYSVKIIGTDIVAVSAGNHLCDAVYAVPAAGEIKYIPAIKNICNAERVDLIIPSTDIETYYLALAEDKLPQLSTSPADVSLTFYNKLRTWQSFHAASIPFAETILPSEYRNNFPAYIVKPITGVGSRNIFTNPNHPERFSDEYVVQRLHKGTEITTAFYVTKQKKLHGFITFTRILVNGMTQQCEVTKKYDTKLDQLLHTILKHFDIKGACNIQSIVEERSGKIIPFEVNGRISGTNSIRSQFGFEDVRYTMDEYLYGRPPKTLHITQGSAIRIMMDIIYPDRQLAVINNKQDKHYMF
jgi:carbamoyl-phosphate synthase large subunit